MIAHILFALLLSPIPSILPVQGGEPRLVAEFGSDNFQHVGRLEDIAYSANGDVLAAVSVDGVLKLWESEGGEELVSYSHPDGTPLFSVEFLHSKTALIGTGGDRIRALSIGPKNELTPRGLDTLGLADLEDSGGGISVAPDGRHLAQWMLKGNVGLLLSEITSDHTRGTRKIISSGDFRVVQVAWSPMGDLCAVLTTNPLKALGRAGTADQDATRVVVLDTSSGKELARFSSQDDFMVAVEFALLEQRAEGSPAQGLLVTGGGQGCQVWDLESSRLLASLAGEVGSVSSLDIQSKANGTADLIVGGRSGLVQSWRIFEDKAPELIAALPRAASLGRISIRPGRSQLQFASIEGRTIRQWSLSDSPKAWFQHPELARHDGVVSALSAAGTRIVSAGFDGLLYLWESQNTAEGKLHVAAKLRLAGSDHLQSLVMDAALSSDGLRLVSCGKDGFVRLWDLSEGEHFGEQIEMWSSESEGSFTSTDFSPDNSLIASASANGTLWIRDGKTGELLRKFEGLRGMDFKASFSADGRFFAVGSTGVRIYDAKTWEQVQVVRDLGSPIMDLALSPAGDRIAIATAGRLLVVRDVVTGELENAWTYFHGRPTAICWASDKWLLAAGARDGGFRVLNTTVTERVEGRSVIGDPGTLVPSPRGGDVKALALLPSGLVVAAGTGGFLHVWDVIR